MKKATLLFFLCFSVLFSYQADACVGKTLNIGVVKSAEGQILAELISSLVNERTGTTLTIKYYQNEHDLYAAVSNKQVDLLIENTSRAQRLLNQPLESDPKKAFDMVKTAYERDKGLIWLRPFGYLNGNGAGTSSYTSTILRVEVLNNFPVLPRVVDKLGSTINDDAFARLIKSVESGEQPKKIARDFLKSKKII